MGLVDKLFGSYSAKELKRIRPQVDAVLSLEEHYRQMDNKTLQGGTDRFRHCLLPARPLRIFCRKPLPPAAKLPTASLVCVTSPFRSWAVSFCIKGALRK